MLQERRVGLVAHYYMDPELQVRRAPLKVIRVVLIVWWCVRRMGSRGVVVLTCPPTPSTNDQHPQGTLSALQWPHVFVADSLAMGEAAVKMAATGEVGAGALILYTHARPIFNHP